MEINDRLKMMLFAAVALVAIKFALLPVLAWQNDTIDQITQIERRNAKAVNLVEGQQQLFMQMATLDKAYKAKSGEFPTYPDKTSFRLETQIIFDQVLKQEELRSKRFFWRESDDTRVFGNLYKASFNVSFTGMAKSFVLLHGKLVNGYPQFRVPNMNVNLDNYTEKSFGTVDATMTVEAYYWLGGEQ